MGGSAAASSNGLFTLVLEGPDIGRYGLYTSGTVHRGFLQLTTRRIIDIGDRALGPGGRPYFHLPGKVQVVVDDAIGGLGADIFIQVAGQVAVHVVGIIDGGRRLAGAIGT